MADEEVEEGVSAMAVDGESAQSKNAAKKARQKAKKAAEKAAADKKAAEKKAAEKKAAELKKAATAANVEVTDNKCTTELDCPDDDETCIDNECVMKKAELEDEVAYITDELEALQAGGAAGPS